MSASKHFGAIKNTKAFCSTMPHMPHINKIHEEKCDKEEEKMQSKIRVTNIACPEGKIVRRGQDGKPGRDGRDGKDGKDGINGKDGRPGRDGKDGRNGEDGREGRDGEEGPQGPQGPRGLVGPQGPQGPSGPSGRDGRDGRDCVCAQNNNNVNPTTTNTNPIQYGTTQSFAPPQQHNQHIRQTTTTTTTAYPQQQQQQVQQQQLATTGYPATTGYATAYPAASYLPTAIPVPVPTPCLGSPIAEPCNPCNPGVDPRCIEGDDTLINGLNTFGYVYWSPSSTTSLSAGDPIPNWNTTGAIRNVKVNPSSSSEILINTVNDQPGIFIVNLVAYPSIPCQLYLEVSNRSTAVPPIRTDLTFGSGAQGQTFIPIVGNTLVRIDYGYATLRVVVGSVSNSGQTDFLPGVGGSLKSIAASLSIVQIAYGRAHSCR